MKKLFITILATVLITTFLPFTIAEELSIDISGLKGEEYNPGEDIKMTIVLLKETDFVEREVTITIQDVLGKKEITKKALSNKEITIPIEQDFPGGIWTIHAQHEETEVERTFLVGERTGVEFAIEGDELIIRNNGNVRYTKTIQITIGRNTESYLQNIGVGAERRLKLVSPQGKYDIVVTDGKTTLRKQNIELFGTGNVIGAVDKELVGYTGFAGASEVTESEDRQVSLTKLPVSLTFIAAMFILGILVFVERRMTKQRKQ